MLSLHVLNAIYKKTYESIVHFPGTYVLVGLKCSSAILSTILNECVLFLSA